MSLDYEHHITVTRPAQTDGLGQATGSAQVVYNGPADVQEKAVYRMAAQGQAVQVGQATAFLPFAAAGKVHEGDRAEIDWGGGTTQSATVAETSRLDGKIVLTYT